MRRIRIYLAYGSVARAAEDASVANEALRRKMADQALRQQMVAGRGYRYRRCRGKVAGEDKRIVLDLSATAAGGTRTDSTAVPFVYDRLLDKFVDKARWEAKCDAFVYRGRAITNLEIEIGSIDADVWEDPTLRQIIHKTLARSVGGPIQSDAKTAPAVAAKPHRGPPRRIEAAMLRQLQDQGPKGTTVDKLLQKSKKDMAAEYGCSESAAFAARPKAIKTFEGRDRGNSD
jgi:hypothetical protein